MMFIKSNIILDVCKSYEGDGAWHRARLIAIFFLALFLALYSYNIEQTALPAMALSISVLAGFTFSALFASGAVTSDDLPPIRNESHRQSRKKLERVADNFRVRSRLFLAASVFCLFLVVLKSIVLDTNEIGRHLGAFPIAVIEAIYEAFIFAHRILSHAVTFVAFFVFFEILYLFYRMSESIFAIIDIRRNY